MKFKDFNLSDKLQEAINDAGYEEATEIQEKSIPVALEGNDIVGLSQTGSGKTAAFGLPAIENVDLTLTPKKTQVIILCPTRELAMQATEELRKFSKYIAGLHVVPVYGGAHIEKQIQQLRKGCQIVVGTPGRVMDHMRRKTLKIDEIRMVILDEADEMLNMGFREDIELILSKTPAERQTLLFSATMPKAILNITKNFQHNPVTIKIERKEMTVSTIEQLYYQVDKKRKKDALALLLHYYQPKLSIIFCNTKRMVDDLVTDLEKRGYSAQGLHGDMKQSQRTQVMQRFKNGGFGILVATDVAARGIDVNDIDVVFNFDLPDDNEYYVHRIGRTGRAGKDGKSITLIDGRRQLFSLHDIEKYAKCKVKKKELPKVKDIRKKNVNQALFEITDFMSNNSYDNQQDNLEKLMKRGYTSEEIACALMEIHFKQDIAKNGIADVPDLEIGKGFDRERSYGRNSGNSNRAQRRIRDRDVDGASSAKRNNRKSKNRPADVDMEKVTISIGSKNRVLPGHILGAVTGESGLEGSMMGHIDIHNDYTTVEVPKQFKGKIVKSLNNKKIKNIKVMAK